METCYFCGEKESTEDYLGKPACDECPAAIKSTSKSPSYFDMTEEEKAYAQQFFIRLKKKKMQEKGAL